MHLYIHNSVKYSNVSVIKEKAKAWYLSFDIYVNKLPIILAGIYLSASENKSQLLESLEQWHEQISENKTLVMSSDTTYSRRLKNLCDDNGLKMFINVNPGNSKFIDTHRLMFIKYCLF